jgi:hypothetical protein
MKSKLIQIPYTLAIIKPHLALQESLVSTFFLKHIFITGGVSI